jgi:hypothetical protein
VTIEPVTERPCEPVPPQTAYDFGSPWGLYARACKGQVGEGHCEDPGMTCEPSAEAPPPGFRQCIAYGGAGDTECPDTYPEKHTFFGGLEDTRECTPCECSQTVASNCLAWLTLYDDTACVAPLFSKMIATGGNGCDDIAIAGAELGSMKAEWITEEPGTCVASGGAPQGEAKALSPKTFCCLPSR